MKKSASLVAGAFLLIAAGLSGCPVYDDDAYGCGHDSDCAPGYRCDEEAGTCYDEPESESCRRPTDCGINETCSRSATCTIGDCHFDSVGCVQGYSCLRVDGRWACVDEDDLGQGGAPAGGAPPATGGSPSAAGQANAGAGGSN